MSKDYEIQENECLLKIAKQEGFQCVNPIVDANPSLPQKCGGNLDVLPPGAVITIPDIRQRSESACTDANHVFQVKTARKDLVITLQTPDSAEIRDGHYRVSYHGQKARKMEGRIQGASFRIEDWPTEVSEADLHVTLKYNKRVEEPVPEGYGADGRINHTEIIKLYVGGLDPLVGSETDRGKAVQKILTNLGFYSGEIDGDLASEASRAAIIKFQYIHKIEPKVSALIDGETMNRLKNEQQNRIGDSGAPSQCQAQERDRPLSIGTAAGTKLENVTEFSKYLEPRDPDQHRRRKFGVLRYFPRQAFVAPCNPGATDNPNVIRMKTRRFIFLDSGRWLGTGRDFSVIWGRHVYRCEYKRDGGCEKVCGGDEKRLDFQFFKAMDGRVKVCQTACAAWAADCEFDWNTLIVVIPDTHLMTGENGKIWRGEFLLDPELDLLDLAKRLIGIDGLSGKVQVVQIGDSYDLWVACAPRFFLKNDDLLIELTGEADQRWNCGAMDCERHKSPSETCKPWSILARWHCARRYPDCPGHMNSGEQCKDVAGARWDCGRVSPPCRMHPHPSDLCPDGYEEPGAVWACRKTEPPCPRHPKRSECCPEHINALDKVNQWIQDIRGIGSGWVRPLLQGRPEKTDQYRVAVSDAGGAPVLLKKDFKNALPPDLTLDQLENELSTAVGRTVRWLNPAERALKLLADQCELVYIHGNHDNYLILERVTSYAGIPKRKKFWETDGVFIEHGHRLEATLIAAGDPIVPTNYDGSITGYKTTIDHYVKRKNDPQAAASDPLSDAADWAAQQFQQPQYWGEFAQVWIGRQTLNTGFKPPHIFVIGHTHKPMLAYINIDFSKFF